MSGPLTLRSRILVLLSAFGLTVGLGIASALPVLTPVAARAATGGSVPIGGNVPKGYDITGNKKPMPSAPRPLASSKRVGAINVCLYNDVRFCWVSNGIGNQVTISSSAANYSTVTPVHGYTDPHGDPVEQYQNGNGHCFYEKTNQQFSVASGACTTSSNDEWFIVATDGTLYSINTGDVILVYNNVEGKPVWVQAPSNGVWKKWTGDTR
jgi:hypothetical protein